MGCSGGALGTLLFGFPCLGARHERIEWNGLICLGLSSLSRSDLIPYITR
jgi:hypothetical protein